MWRWLIRACDKFNLAGFHLRRRGAIKNYLAFIAYQEDVSPENYFSAFQIPYCQRDIYKQRCWEPPCFCHCHF
jgi:hypothetical protein